eukprot:2901470-Prymnesium_polylepis.2
MHEEGPEGPAPKKRGARRLFGIRLEVEWEGDGVEVESPRDESGKAEAEPEEQHESHAAEAARAARESGDLQVQGDDGGLHWGLEPAK